MSLQAYQQAATRAENPRETEYRLFAQVTLALMEAAKCDPTDIRGRIDALDWNRRMWSVLGTDCSDSENGLPPPLRASIISLSIWVAKHTSAVIRREEEIQPLIDVNRTIMQGLIGGGSAAAA
ncbi:flagellar biosynthesis regulatory protein FlaF [Phenylobacterium hankyongense]|uniref:Flagellar biosynthesis regulatory protein FlaF n=1 Tax=Phenylobacterium hankyongense TaxID=1813876 RepID=A0A328B8M8_9CAUL|nr:flagellar biosynthesis regulator FlaF [Phenylobacterium hankyongense]RAK61348.1 flagellar biosynthesis regulatory protein FlaF [Phenylobacterium hankyongense]